MKKLFLLTGLVIFTSFLTLKSQNINLYCTGNDTTGGQTVNPTFYKIDAFSATATPVNSLQNEVYGMIQGSSTFDHSCHHYIFSGVDTNQIRKVYTIDTLGNIISNPVMSNLSINALQYDMKNQIIYGFVCDTSTNTRYLGITNTNNASINLINELDVMGIQVGGVTFNSNTGKYIFIGPDINWDNRLYIINAQYGTIENDILLNSFYLIGSLQYDNQKNKLYGICRDTLNLVPKYFAEIDTLTADVTILDTLYNLYGIVSGSQIYDQATSTFIFTGFDTSQVRRLYLIDASTGQIISDSPISGIIGGDIECDNTNFAKSFYNTSSITEEKSTLYNLTIYPNPSKGTFQLSFYVEKPENIIIQIINDLGQNVCKQEHKKFKGKYNKEIDISSLKNGIYMLNIKVGENTYTKNISVMR